MAGRILIVEGVAINRILLRSRLQGACYDVDLAADGRAGLQAALQRPDLVILDAQLPDLCVTGFLSRLRALLPAEDLPVVVLSDPATPLDRTAVYSAGADAILDKSTDEQSLLARLRSLLRSRCETPAIEGLPVSGLAEGGAAFDRPALVGLVTARPETALRLRKDIGAHLSDRIAVMTRGELLGERRPGDPVPDALVLDCEPENPASALQFVAELRSRIATRHIAIALILPLRAPPPVAVAYDVGVNDLWPTGLDGRESAMRLKRLIHRKRQSDRARMTVEDRLRLAHVDPLTGLHNRRYAMPRLAAIADRGRANGQPFAVMVVDLDRFKLVNDCFGHAAGDSVLVEVSRRLRGFCVDAGLLARIGGEEFLLVLPGIDGAEAEQRAAALCHAIEAAPVRLGDGTEIQVTVSVGLAIGRPAGNEEPEIVMDRADRALLESKSSGRNQVTVGRTAA
ncbi:diguanylate cyclase domain-containing protein [Neotabrizicola shimadae]|uniref:diguanylate cyclase n=1 Tax=Neotabrizicola shimadae TaxID=2807096 RepID=A0A8G0ZQF8_9RHOB|nr:diguanylate cyclase [Neotabrizicola shimadae]QYZ68524.1 diguanylate cyclase [Neotabrizicola shimadae]